MNRAWLRVFVSVACVAAVFLASNVVGFGSSLVTAANSTPIVIGEDSDITGSVATFLGRNPQHDGYVAAVDYINAHGGVQGRKIKLVTCDGKSDPSRGPICAQQFIAANAVGTVGFDSAWGMSGAPQSMAAGIPNFSYPNDINELNGSKAYPNLGGGYNSYPAQAKYFAQVKKVKRAVVFYVDLAVGVELKNVYDAALARFGVQSVTDVKVSPTAADQTPAVIQIKNANPDVVFCVCSPPLAIKAAAQVGLKTNWALGDAAIEKAFLTAVGPLADGVYGSSSTVNYFDTKNPQVKIFRNAMAKYVPGVDIFQNTALAFGDMMTLANIMKKIGAAKVTAKSLIAWETNKKNFPFPVYMGWKLDPKQAPKQYPHDRNPYYMITRYTGGKLHFLRWENGWSK